MRKGNILFAYLIFLTIFIEIYTLNLKIITHKATEYKMILELNNYSFIESEVLIETIKRFQEYKMEDFIHESNLGLVYIYYFDEIAYIKYDFNKGVYARLNYDLIYDSCFDYEIIPEALFPIVDKIKS